MEFSELEPFGEIRADYRAASIREMIHNMAVPKRHRKPLKHFLLQFGKEPAERKQTPEEQSRMMRQIFAIYSVPMKDV